MEIQSTFEGESVTIRPHTNLTYARFQVLFERMLTFSSELAAELDATEDEVRISLAEFAQLSTQTSRHPRLVHSTDSLTDLRQKSLAWLQAPPADFDELRTLIERVRTELVSRDTAPVPLAEDADPKA